MKIICVGRNYPEHIEELKNATPKSPIVFIKPDNAVLRNNEDFYYPTFSQNIHYEVELLVKFHKKGKNIQAKYANKYYNQIALGIDFTARDIQNELKAKGYPWEIAKGFDSSAVLGKWRDVGHFDMQNIQFSLHKNGEVVQNGNSKNMLFGIDEIIAYVSQFFMLKIGDVLFTGTPSGVGSIQIGDRLTGYLQGEKNFEINIK